MSARRGSVNGTLSRENRTLSNGWRAQDQERRASARRGSRKCICMGDTANMQKTATAGLADVVAIVVAL